MTMILNLALPEHKETCPLPYYNRIEGAAVTTANTAPCRLTDRTPGCIEQRFFAGGIKESVTIFPIGLKGIRFGMMREVC